MEITTFVRKYINLMTFGSSFPLMICITISIAIILTNMIFAIHRNIVVGENLEKTLQGLNDCSITLLVTCNLIKRILNKNEEVIKLLKLIESDFEVNRHELAGRNDDLWQKIQKYSQKKTKEMASMSRNLKTIFFVSYLAVTNRNVILYLSGLSIDSKDESTNWPTPLISYCPPELKSPSLFIYFYVFLALMSYLMFSEGFLIIFLVCLSTERVLADFDILIMLLDDLVLQESDPRSHFSNTLQQSINQHNISNCSKKEIECLKRDMYRIVNYHQTLNRDSKVCAHGTFMISLANLAIMIYCCTMAYLLLITDDLKKRMNFAVSFILVSLCTFFSFHNGQRILNQNVTLRKKLAELPWTDKPLWFKRILHVMMTRANVNIEMRPFGIYTLNYVSFKDLIKSTYSFGNILYTQKS